MNRLTAAGPTSAKDPHVFMTSFPEGLERYIAWTEQIECQTYNIMIYLCIFPKGIKQKSENVKISDIAFAMSIRLPP